MKYIIAVLLSAIICILAKPTPAFTKTVVHNDLAVKPTVQPVTPAKLVQPQPEKAVAPTPQVSAPQPQPATHVDLMAAAGIQPKDYGAADYIISRESGWNPDATEPTSGAHGLPQALPYSKTGCGWTDSICQLRWANAYAEARYGGWWQAQAFWSANLNW